MNDLYWDCGDNDADALRKIVSENVQAAVKDLIKKLEPAITNTGRNDAWEIYYIDCFWFDVCTKPVTLRGLFKKNLEVAYEDIESLDRLLADLKWCIKRVEKAKAKTENRQFVKTLESFIENPGNLA